VRAAGFTDETRGANLHGRPTVRRNRSAAGHAGGRARQDVAVQTEEAGPRDGVWSPGRRALTLGLVLMITLVAFEAFAIATVMPKIKDDLGGIGWYGWVFSAFFLANLLGIVWAGHSSDHHGPARAFTVGLLLFALGLLLGGAAPAIGWLVAARAVQGLGAGAIPAIAYVAIGRGYPVHLQPRMFAVVSTAWVVPSLIGPGISGVVADTLGWRWVLLGLLPIVLVAGAIATPALRRLGAPGGDAPRDRRRDALIVTFGAALVLTAASSRSVVLAPVLAVAGLIFGGRAFARIMPPGTLRLSAGLPAAIALRGLATFAFFGTDAYVTLTLTSLRGAGLVLAGLPLTAAALTWTAGSWVQERAVLRVGPRAFVRTGCLIIACGVGGMIVVAQFAVPIGFAFVAWAVAGFGMGISYSPVSLVVLAEAPVGGEGTASASLQLCDVLGIALGTGVSGAIVAAGAALGWAGSATLTIAFAGCIVVAIIAAAGAVRLPAHVAR
jgi:MFS family permease